MQINPIIEDNLRRIYISTKSINPIRCHIGILYDKHSHNQYNNFNLLNSLITCFIPNYKQTIDYETIQQKEYVLLQHLFVLNKTHCCQIIITLIPSEYRESVFYSKYSMLFYPTVDESNGSKDIILDMKRIIDNLETHKSFPFVVIPFMSSSAFDVFSTSVCESVIEINGNNVNNMNIDNNSNNLNNFNNFNSTMMRNTLTNNNNNFNNNQNENTFTFNGFTNRNTIANRTTLSNNGNNSNGKRNSKNKKEICHIKIGKNVTYIFNSLFHWAILHSLPFPLITFSTLPKFIDSLSLQIDNFFTTTISDGKHIKDCLLKYLILNKRNIDDPMEYINLYNSLIDYIDWFVTGEQSRDFVTMNIQNILQLDQLNEKDENDQMNENELQIKLLNNIKTRLQKEKYIQIMTNPNEYFKLISMEIRKYKLPIHQFVLNDYLIEELDEYIEMLFDLHYRVHNVMNPKENIQEIIPLYLTKLNNINMISKENENTNYDNMNENEIKCYKSTKENLMKQLEQCETVHQYMLTLFSFCFEFIKEDIRCFSVIIPSIEFEFKHFIQSVCHPNGKASNNLNITSVPKEISQFFATDNGITAIEGKKMKRSEVFDLLKNCFQLRKNYVNLFDEKIMEEMSDLNRNEKELPMENEEKETEENNFSLFMKPTTEKEDEEKKPKKLSKESIGMMNQNEMKEPHERQSIYSKDVGKERIRKENKSYLIGNVARIKHLRKLFNENQHQNEYDQNDIFVKKETQIRKQNNYMRLMNLKKEYLMWKELHFEMEEKMKMIENL